MLLAKVLLMDVTLGSGCGMSLESVVSCHCPPKSNNPTSSWPHCFPAASQLLLKDLPLKKHCLATLPHLQSKATKKPAVWSHLCYLRNE